MRRAIALVVFPLAAFAAPAKPVDPAEMAAYEAARPVFERHCTRCHAKTGDLADKKAIKHVEMGKYPFHTHHPKTIAQVMRRVLGATGKKAVMPEDDPGVVTGEDLARILAWADAYDAARGIVRRKIEPRPEPEAGGRNPEPEPEAGTGTRKPEPEPEPKPVPEPEPAVAESTDAVGPAVVAAPAPPRIPIYADEPGEAPAQLGFAKTREMLIPGNPGEPAHYHFMLSAHGHAQNTGLGGSTRGILANDWAMAYARSGGGLVEGLLMFNFEALHVGRAGIPELGQQGEGLWDAQHPHILVHQAMLSVHPLARLGWAPRDGDEPPMDLAFFAGAGAAPIGPPVFMHRASSPGPTVPRKHHKGENPHETFPVVGALFRLRDTIFEAAACNGHELGPDDNRIAPPFGAPTSVAARARQTLGERLELQISGLRIAPEDEHGAVWQASASVYGWTELAGLRIDALADWAIDAAHDHAAQAALGELAVRTPSRRDVFWLRGEWNEREEPEELGGFVSGPWLFATAGFEHVVYAHVASGLQIGVFAEATYAAIPSEVAPRYGRDGAMTVNVGLHLFGMWALDEDGERVMHDE